VWKAGEELAEKRIKALLLDLDDTLLINDMESFIAPYFKALVGRVQHLCPPGVFVEALSAGTRAMWQNDGGEKTNAEVFHDEFFSRIEQDPALMMPLFDAFYEKDYDALAEYTKVDPDARVLLELASEQGYQLVVATQPIFPLAAIQARLRWAGVGVKEFAYDYIATYDTMSACKPHPCFFQAILTRLERLPGECLMVGDSLDADMPAAQLGIKTFWVDRGRFEKPSHVVADAQGSLRDLITLLQTGEIHEL